ncbi:MerR family transcriptional regulator [Amycolatopsis suaedae]|uniref:MerR family transcriptional regulator n=1 Tax=Amycolatopsis suaedae TaxID=2510978 RepID=A0A4Q7JBJ0_9PSEU|nr:MerR family transcriptional regulator [Amycolatopsis suaedae]RZQ63863.1 MerR family transcriptional regulator [Amycolatopsis suaedae]
MPKPQLGREGGLRSVDLARSVGISAQQIRNYVDAGILPPARRSPSGHRRFDERHQLALTAYRTLATGFGWETARSIMRALHGEGTAVALAHVDAAHAALHEQRQSVRVATEALEAIAGQAPEDAVPARSGLRVGEVAAQLGVRTSALRLWESAGLLVPGRERGTGYRRYDAADVRDARMVILLRQARYPLARIRVVLDDLRSAGSTAALRAAMADREAAMTATATAMLAGAAALHRYLAAGV